MYRLIPIQVKNAKIDAIYRPADVSVDLYLPQSKELNKTKDLWWKQKKRVLEKAPSCKADLSTAL